MSNNINDSTDKQNKDNAPEQDKYKSSKLLLEYISKEHDKEDERSKNIDSRISIFITISIFFLGYMFSDDVSKVSDMLNANVKLYATYIVIFMLCVMSIFLSIGSFIWIMCSKKYKRIAIHIFQRQDVNAENENKVAYELIKGYREALEHNIKMNDHKMKIYKLGIILLVTSVVMFIVLKIYLFLVI